MVDNRGRRMARISRGDMWIADLRPGVGFEVTKKRPTLIISRNTVNEISPTVIVIPLSSQVYKILGPERISIPQKDSSLHRDSVALVTQMRAIDKTRLIKKVGPISKDKLKEVEQALKIVLDFTH